MLKISQITDLHIGETDEDINGVNTRKNVKGILSAIVQSPPDLIIVSGDLALNNGEIAAYQWIKKQLDQTGIPYWIMAGNHDLRENLKATFELEYPTSSGKFYCRRTINGKTIFLLDSSPNSVDREQLEWLVTEANKVEDAFLFIHHPPIYCRCFFMDSNYPLLNTEEVFKYLAAIPNINHIFCGHYHTEKHITKQGKNIYLTPSTYIQISQDDPNKVSNYKKYIPIAGWRTIVWDDDIIETFVNYINL